MRDTGWLLPALVVLGFAASHAGAWLIYRRWAQQQSTRLQARFEHLMAERERRFAILHDGLLQDVQGLALSLQAIADELAQDSSLRPRLERILDRTDEFLAEGRRRVKGRRDDHADA